MALTDDTFEVGPGVLMGILGPNGAGKSTLFDAIARVLPITQGTVDLHGAEARKGALAYVPQRDSIKLGLPRHRAGRGDYGMLQRRVVPGAPARRGR